MGFDATDNVPTALDHDDLDGRVDCVERGIGDAVDGDGVFSPFCSLLFLFGFGVELAHQVQVGGAPGSSSSSPVMEVR